MSKPDRVCFDYHQVFWDAIDVDPKKNLGVHVLGTINEAKSICKDKCPEAHRLECLREFGDDEWGVVGGMFASERRAIGIPARDQSVRGYIGGVA
jgi:hypothetical protein